MKRREVAPHQDVPLINLAARALVAWVQWEVDLRAKARRTYAVIDGRVLDSTAVLFHDPQAIRMAPPILRSPG